MPKKSKKFTIKESNCHCNRRWKYFRGVAGASNGMDRVQGDYMGMLATVINGMALQGLRRQRDAYPFTNCIKNRSNCWTIWRAVRHLEKGRIVILEPEPETLILPLIQQLFCVVKFMPTWFWKEHASTFMIQILKKCRRYKIWFYFFWRRN
jgi:hypothetical protein